MSSAIAAVVDYTAALAAGIAGVALPNGSTVGVRSVYGAGQGVILDPLRPGAFVQPVPDAPTEPFVHWSRLPDAPTIEWVSMQSVELTWTVPMRLWLPRSDSATAAQTALPFYDAYLARFTPDYTLGGMVLRSSIKSMKPDTDESWFWLDVELEVVEVVVY
jgi:hypothetical protein